MWLQYSREFPQVVKLFCMTTSRVSQLESLLEFFSSSNKVSCRDSGSGFGRSFTETGTKGSWQRLPGSQYANRTCWESHREGRRIVPRQRACLGNSVVSWLVRDPLYRMELVGGMGGILGQAPVLLDGGCRVKCPSPNLGGRGRRKGYPI